MKCMKWQTKNIFLREKKWAHALCGSAYASPNDFRLFTVNWNADFLFTKFLVICSAPNGEYLRSDNESGFERPAGVRGWISSDIDKRGRFHRLHPNGPIGGRRGTPGHVSVH